MTAIRQREIEAARAVVATVEDAGVEWRPEHYDMLDAAVPLLAELVRRYDRDEARRAQTATQHPARVRLRSTRGNETPIAARRAVEARSGGLCEVDTDACPAGRHPADQIHHRDRNRKNNELANLLHVCTLGHGFIHEHPEESFAQGWMTHRNGAVVQPLYLRGER